MTDTDLNSKIHEKIGSLTAKTEMAAQQIDTLFAESRTQTQMLTRIEATITQLSNAHTVAAAASGEKHEAMQRELEDVQKDVGNLKKWQNSIVAFVAGISFIFTLAWAVIKELWH